MKKLRSGLLICVLVAIAFLGFVQSNDAVAVGFCEFETNCSALCACADPHYAIVPAFCCPASPCWG